MPPAFQRLVVGAFGLLLLLPGLQMASGLLPVAPLEENRRPAPMPPIAAMADPSSYVTKLQAWFDDHYGLRNLLIRTKTQIDYSVFRSSDRLHIGRDGYLFYRSVIDREEPQIERLSDAELDRLAGNFARLRDWLAPRGVQLVVQTQQLKDRFYPEYLPREAQFARHRRRFDDVMARMQAVPGITFINTTPTLLQLKAERPIFHRTDFHWNDPAAFVVAGQLVDRLAGLSGRPTPFWRVPLRIATRRYSGGQAMFMPLFRPPSEMALFVDPTWDESDTPRSAQVGPFEWVARAARPDAEGRLPTTVIFGDSFVEGMSRAGLATHFNELRFARLFSVPLPEVLRAMPPDTRFLVVEFIETSVLAFMSLELPP